MSTAYETRRNAIHSALSAVSGIGKVFKTHRHVQDWQNFLNRFVQNDKVNVCWFTLASVSETTGEQGGVGESDERDFINWTERVEQWQIELFYGFKDADDDGSPSEYAFQLLAEAVENAFRFKQTLGASSDYKTYPLTRVNSGLWKFLGEVLCHRAEWTLTVKCRVENPA